MRVTTNAFNNNFLNSYNTLLSQYLKAQTKVLTQKKFLRASEDSQGAAKAGHIRKSLANLDIYDENLKTTKDLFYAAEDALYDIANKTYIDVSTKVVSVQDTYNQTEFDAIALELEQYADHMMRDMNTDFATRQMFGSCSDDKTPFTAFSKVEVNGKMFDGGEGGKIVCYNDLPVNMNADELSPLLGTTFDVTYYNDDGTSFTKTISYDVNDSSKSSPHAYDKFPGTNPIYVDVGLGIKYDDNGNVTPSTAFNVSLNGVEFTGCGTDKDGDSQNIIQLVFDAAKALKDGDRAAVNAYIDKLDNANTQVLNGIINLGVKQNNLQMYMDRNDVYRLSLKEKQNTVEGVDIEGEITNMKSIEAAYNAALSMGGSVLPKSIFDFV